MLKFNDFFASLECLTINISLKILIRYLELILLWIGVVRIPYFSEDDSAESSNAEDEEESEAGETEPDTEEAFLDEQLERRSNGGSSGPRPNLAPQHMQWALRQREPGRGPITTSGRLGMSKFQSYIIFFLMFIKISKKKKKIFFIMYCYIWCL